jgi:hypothetical protein
MSEHSCLKHRISVLVMIAGWLALLVAVAPPADAQTSSTGGTNNGAIRFTGGVDVPSVYVFRGILQEVDPKITLWPYGDIGIALRSGDGFVKSCAVNVGVWNSLNTGSSGSNGPSKHAHYEEDFYTTVNLGFGGGLGVGFSYMALTSPNNVFNTVKEFQIKLTKANRLNPYGFLATELTDKSADGGANKGTYLELGVGPAFPLGGSKATVTIPVKVGLSAKDYYENPLTGKDSKFGWFDVGGLITIPLSGVPSRFGSWNVHGGADVLVLGDTTELFNVDSDRNTSKNKVVGLVGVGLSY